MAALWNTEERRGDGVFDPLKGTVEGSNPFASTIWEGELLRLHFSPKVKEALDIILRNIRAAQ
jgi:nucleolar complex protein 3